MRPRGELNGTSQPIFFLSPREKRANIPPFVVQTHLPFLFQSFPPFSPFTCLILLSVSFTSPRHSLRLATKLISPLLSLKAPPISSCPYSSPSFFFIEGPQSCFTSPSSVIPPPHFSSSLNPGDWSPLLLISPPSPLLSVPPVLSGLFAGPPSAALSGVSACEASALQYILLIGSILCIITPSCLWVQLAQSGPSV